MLRSACARPAIRWIGAYDGLRASGSCVTKIQLILLDIPCPGRMAWRSCNCPDRVPSIPVIIITGLASMQEIRETVRKGPCLHQEAISSWTKVLVKVGEAWPALAVRATRERSEAGCTAVFLPLWITR